MEFELLPALVAGFVATVVMSALVTMAKRMGMTDMPPFPLVTGTMFSGNEDRARLIGGFVHYGMMGTVVFGVAYALVFDATGSSGWVTGLVTGVAHGVLVGLVMAVMPVMHPRMERSLVTAGAGGATVDRGSGGQVRLAEPGVFGSRWGAMTPVGILMGHAVYGLVLALVYGALT